MTIDEIKKTLPNGFHDSDILNISLDFVNQTAEFLIDVDLCDPNHEAAETSRKGILSLSGLVFFSIEPPRMSFPGAFIPSDDRMWITSDTSDFSTLKFTDTYPGPMLPAELPTNSFQHFFYLSSHNCCIYLAAMDAQFEWEGKHS